MKFIQTLKNIWTIQELRQRLVITVLLVLVYRLGCYVVLPGINPNDLDALTSFTNRSGLMQLLDMFSGGAFSQASIFALGIMPYITASIVIQLAGMVLPSFQKMQREGESGRQKLNQYTRYLTVLILLVQGPAYLYNLRLQVVNAGGQVEMGIWTVISSLSSSQPAPCSSCGSASASPTAVSATVSRSSSWWVSSPASRLRSSTSSQAACPDPPETRAA